MHAVLYDAAVLVLVWGTPPRTLYVRKNCGLDSYWSCDIAFPGGRVRPGESPVEAALREAWEEAWVHPRLVEAAGVLDPEYTRRAPIRITPVLARPKGPLCPRPASSEVDAVFWERLDVAASSAVPVRHPRRGVVEGVPLLAGVLWGATYRITRRVYRLLHEGSTL